MFKSLRHKIQSLSETQQNILTILLILINLGIIIFWVGFWISLSKTTSPKIEGKPPVEEEKVPQEVIEKLSTPSSEGSKEVPEEVLENLSAPKK